MAKVYVCEDCKGSGRVLGYLVLGYEDKNMPHIYRIGVSPSAQGKGIGSKLLEQFVRGVCSVATMADNTSSIKFYEKHGFKVETKFEKSGHKMVFLRR